MNGEALNVLPVNLLLVTAISKPKRLLEFLPKSTKMEAFEDHHNFTLEELVDIKKRYEDYTIITTSKDFVKLKELNLDMFI